VRRSGVQLRDAFAEAELEREIKWHAKFARENGTRIADLHD
jgi:hypothetical protein